MVTYPKMPPCCNLNARYSTKLAGGRVAAFVNERQQMHFYTPCSDRRGFKRRFKFYKDRISVSGAKTHLEVARWQSNDRREPGDN